MGRLLALQLVLLDCVGSLQQILLLLHVRALQTRRHRRARVAACVQDVPAVVVLGLIEQGLDPGLREAPSASVEWLFLAPDDVLRVRVAVELFLELRPWEGVQLLDTDDGSVGDLVLLTVLVQDRVGLACAEDRTLYLLFGLQLELLALLVELVGDNPLEVRVTSKVLDGRASKRVTEKVLGEEQDKSCRDTLGSRK